MPLPGLTMAPKSIQFILKELMLKKFASTGALHAAADRILLQSILALLKISPL